jgi:hypothetical protein
MQPELKIPRHHLSAFSCFRLHTEIMQQQQISPGVNVQEEVTDLAVTIERLEKVLAEVTAIESSYDRRSDIGWLFSMIANEAGTLAAVTQKKKAQKWQDVRHDVEEQIRRLRTELRLKDHEQGAGSK